MEDTGHKDAAGVSPIEHHMSSMLDAAQAGANMVAGAA